MRVVNWVIFLIESGKNSYIDSNSGIPCKVFSVNPSLESWHNRVAAIWGIDQTVRVFLGFQWGVENDGAVSMFVYCLMSMLNSYHNFMLSLQETTQGENFIHVVFNISVLATC